MPRYYAADIKVTLLTTPLSDSTTPNIDMSNTADRKTVLSGVERALKEGKPLVEEEVQYSDDQHATHFLDGTPFRFVKTSPIHHLALIDPSKRTEDLAIYVVIDFSHNTASRKFNSCDRRVIRADVFMNGKLSACNIFHPRQLPQNQRKQMIVSGRRCGLRFERAWISSRSRQHSRCKHESRHASGIQRWHDLQRTLLAETDRYGRTSRGCRPPIAKYLESLATMEAPSSLSSWQCAFGKAFGIVDVVISLGHGRKDGVASGYSLQPTLPRDPLNIEECVQQSRDSSGTSNATHDTNTALAVPSTAPNPDIHEIQSPNAPVFDFGLYSIGRESSILPKRTTSPGVSPSVERTTAESTTSARDIQRIVARGPFPPHLSDQLSRRVPLYDSHFPHAHT